MPAGSAPARCPDCLELSEFFGWLCVGPAFRSSASPCLELSRLHGLLSELAVLLWTTRWGGRRAPRLKACSA